MQHLRIGSVVTVMVSHGSNGASLEQQGATVTNLTDSYLEVESQSGAGTAYSWAYIAEVIVTQD